MVVNLIIEYFSRNLVPENCHGLESSAICTAPLFVDSLPGRISRSLSRVSLNIQAEEDIATFFMSNNCIGVCLPQAVSLTRLWLPEMFKVLVIVRTNNSVGLQGIFNFDLLIHSFFTGGQAEFLPKREFLQPLHSKVRTPLPHRR